MGAGGLLKRIRGRPSEPTRCAYADLHLHLALRCGTREKEREQGKGKKGRKRNRTTKHSAARR